MTIIDKVNEIYISVNSDDNGIIQTIKDKFSFHPPNYWFNPKYRKKVWNGRISLYRNNLLYLTFLPELKKELDRLNEKYEVLFEENKSTDDIESWIESLKLPFKPHKHQIDLVKCALYMKKMTGISPTGSGKSLDLYLYIKYLIDNNIIEGKVLLIVPQISLVFQMRDDFIKYDIEGTIKNKIHLIMGGREKLSKEQIYISTWQSIYSLPISYFEQFDVLIVDEVHLATANSISKIVQRCINANYRLGVTGTLKEWKSHRMMIEGLMGEIVNVTTTNELIEKKLLSPLKIFNIILSYSDKDREKIRNVDIYEDELEFILYHDKRNLIIKKMIDQLKMNTLVLFNRINHGKLIFDMIKDKKEYDVMYIDGAINVEVREQIRKKIEEKNNCILIASSQIFSTGINIKRLHNIVLLIGGSSKIRLLQSIGRGLRVHEEKERLNIVDIIDDLRYKRKYNWMWKQYLSRKKVYKLEKFNFVEKIIKVE